MKLRLAAALLVAASVLAAQESSNALRIRIVEGEGAVYPVGSRSARGVTVQVTDSSGMAVAGASVSFLLPQSGPSGVFGTGSRTEIATTRADGIASAWGMRWNRTPGPVEIRITAAKGEARVTAACPVTLASIAEPASSPAAGSVSRGSRKWLWITLAVAGGAAGGLAAGSLGGKPAGAAAPTVGTTIGAPTISIGRP